MPGLGKHVSDTEGESWGQLSFIILNRKGGGTFLRNNLAATNFQSDYNNAAPRPLLQSPSTLKRSKCYRLASLLSRMLRVFEAVLRLKVMRYVSCANNVQQGGHFILETFFNIPVTPFSVFPAEVLQVGIQTYCVPPVGSRVRMLVGQIFNLSHPQTEI